MDTNRHYIKLCLLLIVLLVGTKANAQTIDINIQGLSIEEQDVFVVPIQISTDLTGEGVFAYRFEITYSASYYEFMAVESIGDMLGTWGLPSVNLSSPGVLRLAGAGAEALVGTGDVIYLKFRSLRSGGNYIGFNANQSYLNEGSPSTTYTSGYIYSAPRSYPNIYPDSGQLFVGDEVTLSASGGLAPYVFTSVSPAIAQIVDDNILRATGPGLTKVYVSDDNSEINYTTGVFDVRAIRMGMPNDLTGWPTQTILLPLQIEVAPGTQVFSGNIEISYPAGVTPSEDPVQQGDYSITLERRVVGNRVHISYATATAVTGSGVLVYVPFVANTPGNHYIAYQSTRFNETLFSFNTNDYIRISTPSDLSITPNTGSLLWNETIALTVNNGTPPYTYEVSDLSVASADASGVITGLSGGIFKVSVTDNFGGATTTGTFTVNDNILSINNRDGNLDLDTRVAISTSQLPANRDIFSFEGNITFNTNYLDFVSVEPLSSGMIIESIVSGGNIQLVGASTNGIASGDVFYLNFRIKNALSILGTTPVNFGAFTLNEGTLFTIYDNGVVTRVQQDSYRPVADAGNNFSANENTLVQLNGSGSFDLDNEPFTYQWVAPQGITLNDATLVDPTFTAPEVNQNSVFTFKLVTNDGTSNSDTSNVDVTILQVNKAPISNAGADASYPEGNSVSLNGAVSSDPDGQALIFNWESIDGIVLFNGNSATPSFIAPSVEIDTDYRFRLVVNDGLIDSEADTVNIQVLQVNQIPKAFAGTDQIVDEGDEVQLDASLSSDPDNDDITYLWTAPPEVTLSSNTVAQPTFTAPSVRLDSILLFSLVVNDGQSNSLADEVNVSVNNIDILSSEADILNVSLTDMESVTINATEATVVLHMPYGYDIRSLSPSFELSAWANISPLSETNQNFTVPQIYVVTAENGTTSKEWTVSVNIPEHTVSRSIGSGWNMLSLPLTPNSYVLNEVLSSLSLAQLDYLKSPLASATWYSGYGWYGDLNEFPAYLTVRLKKATAGTWQLTGKEINPTLESIPVVSGWNSLPYLLKDDADINDAFVPSSIPTGDILIKGEAGAAIYFSGSGWVGALQTMEVLHGYKISMQYSGVLSYDAAGGAVPPTAQLKKATVSNNFGNDFRYSANLISEFVDMYNEPITNENDILRAYNNGVLCGEATAAYVSDLGRYIFVLTYYANNNGETIELKSVREGHEADMFIPRDFLADEIIGSSSNPEKLVLPINTKLGDDFGNGVFISPNPASDVINIRSDSFMKYISVYSSAGSKVININNIGNSYQLNIESLPTGIYFIEVTFSKGVYLHKFIKRSK